MSTQLANNFCSACGGTLIITAIICPKCGSPTSKYVGQRPVQAKSKTSAVLLAVFLGIWSWVYTYQVNKSKFWVTLASFLALSVLLFIRASFISYQIQNGYYPSTGEVIFWRIIAFTWLFTPLAFSIWAIVDNATKPSSWFINYPNEKRAQPNSSGMVEL